MKMPSTAPYEHFITIAIIFAILILLVSIAAWTLYKVVNLICQTTTRNAEIKAFGSSQEYQEFLQWKLNNKQ